ncbi:MAG: aminotransferase class V-fold PLP-dependent enzyme [Chlamydiales bacterium]|nr:aminotransferase class V-fold PLP-dependent enzyme [Chlamydiales bacterium]
MTLYFDHQLTTPPREGVVEKMAPFFHIRWHSPVAPYTVGEPLFSIIEESEQHVRRLLGATDGDHFVFTSSGAEAVNHAIFSTYVDVTRKTGKNHYLSTNMSEAPSILAMTRLQEMGCLFDMVRVGAGGQLSAKSVAESLTPRTAMLSISIACGVTGVIQKIDEIAAICQERGILLHVDVTHLLGKGDVACKADLITFNGEQIGAPKGTGGLLVRNGLEISPLILGGNEQEGMRGGSLNVPALVGLGEAARQAHEDRDHTAMETARLRAVFEERLLALIPDAQIVLADALRVPNITAIVFPKVSTDALAFGLAHDHLFANMGGGNFQQIVHLLKACKISCPHSAISFALSVHTTQEEVLKAAKVVFENVAKLRRYSERL